MYQLYSKTDRCYIDFSLEKNKPKTSTTGIPPIAARKTTAPKHAF